MYSASVPPPRLTTAELVRCVGSVHVAWICERAFLLLVGIVLLRVDIYLLLAALEVSS